jgi:neutral ceramidase
MSMRAGVSMRNITPDVGVSLSGFGYGRTSTGIRDRLYVRALALIDTNDAPAVLVSTDLLAMTAEQIADVRAQVSSAVPSALLIVTHTHTHSGPSVGMLRDREIAPDEYLAHLVDSIASAVFEAVEGAVPATLRIGFATCHLGVNRRLRTPGGVSLAPNPDGPCDRDVAVLRIDGIQGDQIACWFRLAAHPVSLGQDTRVSGDWPAEAVRLLELDLGCGHALFAQGCCGDINPVAMESDDALVQTGLQAAWAARAAWDNATALEPGGWRAALSTVDLPVERQPRPDEQRARLEVQVLKLDDRLAIVGLSAEPFSRVARDVRSLLPNTQAVVVLGYTNGCFGYLPDPDAFEGPVGQRGYEVDDAPAWFRTPRLTPQAHTVAMNTVAEVISALED